MRGRISRPICVGMEDTFSGEELQECWSNSCSNFFATRRIDIVLVVIAYTYRYTFGTMHLLSEKYWFIVTASQTKHASYTDTTRA